MANRNKKSSKKYLEESKEFKKGKSKKGKYSKDCKYDSKEHVSNDVTSKDGEGWNDSKWYIPNDQLRYDVGSFTMSDTIGIDTRVPNVVDGTTYHGVFNIASIMSIVFHPSAGIDPADALGVRTPMNNPLNVCARKLYAAISAENSKTTQYQPSDLGLAILAVGELISLVNLATRAYATAWNYNPRNRQVPRSLVRAMGMDPNSLFSDLTGFRMRLNKLLTSASNIRMLADFKYFNKCGELYSRIYTDTPEGMQNYFVPTTYTYWVLDETTTPSILRDKYINGTSSFGDFTASQLLDAIEDIINSLLNSSTMNYVYTDIVNYVTKRGGALVSFNYIPEMIMITPVYDALFSNQIHNAFPLNDTDLHNVGQNAADGTITWSLNSLNLPKLENVVQLLDFWDTANPTPDYKIDSVMFKSMAENLVTSAGQITSNSIITPDHYVTDIRIVASDASTSATYPNNVLSIASAATTILYHERWYSKFANAPLRYYGDATGETLHSIAGDVNCYTTINFEEFRNILEYAYLGLFDVESAGGSIFNEILARK